jgi:hypothetical protein
MASVIVFDPDAFREQFPNQFPESEYPDSLLQVYWDTAICYISDEDYGCLSGDCRLAAINLMVAHLVTIADKSTSGEQTGFVESATIDKISVTLQSFDNKNQFQWFLNQTPYGQQLYALLYVKSVGGSYYGAYNELGSFRRSGGRFFPHS